MHYTLFIYYSKLSRLPFEFDGGLVHFNQHLNQAEQKIQDGLIEKFHTMDFRKKEYQKPCVVNV
jgi:hypothetical protein